MVILYGGFQQVDVQEPDRVHILINKGFAIGKRSHIILAWFPVLKQGYHSLKLYQCKLLNPRNGVCVSKKLNYKDLVLS